MKPLGSRKHFQAFQWLCELQPFAKTNEPLDYEFNGLHIWEKFKD